MPLVDRFGRPLGSSSDYIAKPGAPDDVLRIWVDGDAFPRIVLDANAGAVLVGDGTGPPVALTSGVSGGAPTDAPYVTIGNSGGLSAETPFSTLILPPDTTVNRPASAILGRLFLASDTGFVSRDKGSGNGYDVIVPDHNQLQNLTSGDPHTQYLLKTAAAASYALQSSLDTESAARISGDATNASAVTTEASARASADTTLQSNITAEAASRSSGDTAAIASAATAAGTAIVAERTITRTLSGAAITPRTAVVNAPGATPTYDLNANDHVDLTGLAAAITSMSSGLTGTPTLGFKRVVSLIDNGTARAITWGASFTSTTIVLPTTTVISKRLYVGLIGNGSTWDCVGVA